MLYQGDCLEIMQGLSTGSIDMILTDLPYGTTRNKWDSMIPLAPLWEQYKRLAKPNAAIVLFAQVPFSCVLGASNLSMLRYEWIWKKDKSTGHLNANRCPMKEHENILVFYQRLPTYHPQMETGKMHHRGGGTGSSNYNSFHCVPNTQESLYYPRSILEVARNTVQLHPTQKPVALCEYLIKTYTDPGETVLDSCMGSGTTCLAALNTGREVIGIERDATIFAGAVRRLEERIPCLIM